MATNVVIQPSGSTTVIIDMVPGSTVIDVVAGTSGNTFQSIDTQTGVAGADNDPLIDVANAPLPTAFENFPFTTTQYTNAGASYYDGGVDDGLLGQLRGEIYFNELGDYTVWGIFYSPRGNTQQWHVGLDGGFGILTNGTFNEWVGDSDFSVGAFTITEAGLAPFVVMPRNDGGIISRLIFTRDPSFTNANLLAMAGAGVPATAIGSAPTIGASGLHETVAPELGENVQLAALAGAGVDPQLNDNDYIVLLNDLGKRFVLNPDGTGDHPFAKALSIPVKRWNGTNYDLLTLSYPANPAATVGTLTLDAPTFAGDAFTLTTNIDLTGYTAAELTAQFGSGVVAITSIDQANPGVISGTYPLDKARAPIGPGLTIELNIVGGPCLATGSGDVDARGTLVDPVATTDYVMYPEAELEDTDGNPTPAEQIEDLGDGTYEVFDGQDWVGVFPVVVTNTAPVLAAIGPQTTPEQVAITIPLSATDAEGLVTFAMTGAPTGAVLTDNGDGTGSITYTSGPGFQGTVSNITVTVSDGTLTDDETFTLTIGAPVADTTAPVVTPQPDISVTQPAPVSVQPVMVDPEDGQLDWSLTVNGVAGAAPWSQDPTTGEITLTPNTSILAPGTYTIVVTGENDAGLTSTDTIVITIAAPAPLSAQAVGGEAFFTANPPNVYTPFEAPLSPNAHPIAVAGGQIEYDPMGGGMQFCPDGTAINTTGMAQTFDVDVHDGTMWSTVTVTVPPILDLESPNWVPPIAVAQDMAFTIVADDLFNAALGEPGATVTYVGFPGTTTQTGNDLTLDTSTLGTTTVTVTAELNGKLVTVEFDLVIAVGTLAPLELVHSQTLDEINSATVNLELAEMAQVHSLDALGALVASVPVDSVTHAQTVDFAPIALRLEADPLGSMHTIEDANVSDINLPAEDVRHDHELALAPIFDINLPTVNVRQRHKVADLTPLQHLSVNIEALDQGHTLDTITALGFPLLLDAALQHGVTLESVTGLLDLGLPGLVDINHIQLVDEIGGPLDIGALVIDMVVQPQTLEDPFVIPNTPLMVTGDITQTHTLRELVNFLQTNSVLSLDDLIHAQLVGGSVPLVLSNTPLIPADGVVVIRSTIIQ